MMRIRLSCVPYVVPMAFPMTSICALHVVMLFADLSHVPLTMWLVMVIMVTAVMIRMVTLTTTMVVWWVVLRQKSCVCPHASYV